MSIIGIDNTKLEAFSREDKDADWGFDHIKRRFYYGYKVTVMITHKPLRW